MLSQGNSLVANFKTLRLFYRVEDIKVTLEEMLSLEFANLLAEKKLYKRPRINESIRFHSTSNLRAKLHSNISSFLLAEKVLCCFWQVIKHLSLTFPSEGEGYYYLSQLILKIHFLTHLEDIQMLQY